jgi:hypothetical protein
MYLIARIREQEMTKVEPMGFHYSSLDSARPRDIDMKMN